MKSKFLRLFSLVIIKMPFWILLGSGLLALGIRI